KDQAQQECHTHCRLHRNCSHPFFLAISFHLSTASCQSLDGVSLKSASRPPISLILLSAASSTSKPHLIPPRTLPVSMQTAIVSQRRTFLPAPVLASPTFGLSIITASLPSGPLPMQPPASGNHLPLIGWAP